MSLYACDLDGRVLQVFNDPQLAPPDAPGLVESDVALAPWECYFDGTEIRKMPAQPSAHHKFDYAAGQWVDPRSDAERAQLERTAYQRARAPEYPAIGDQLDALWKMLGPAAAQGSDAAKIFAQIQSVKARHPKS